jgi:fatty-acid peroxygenase
MYAQCDRTLTLVRQGYRFSDWLDQHVPGRGDATPIRLLGRRTFVLRGKAGVDLFYDADRVSRRRAVPGLVSNGLFGKGSVHGLDGEEHRLRKQLFLEATSAERVADLAARVADTWDAELELWARTGYGSVFPSAVRAIGEAVQEWAGLRAAPVVMRRRAWQLVQIVDGFGAPGLPHLPSPPYAAATCAHRPVASSSRWPSPATRPASSSRCGPPPSSCSTCCARPWP